MKLCSIQPSKFASLGKTEKCSKYVRASQGNVSISPVNKKIQTPLLKMNHTASAGGYSPTSPVAEETKTPLANLANSSCSRDWRLSSGDKSENVEPARKFKRLRKVRDCEQNKNSENMKENAVAPVVNLARRFLGMSPIQNKHGRGNWILSLVMFSVYSLVSLFLSLFIRILSLFFIYPVVYPF